MPKNFGLVMREADRYLAASPPRPMRPAETAPSPEIRPAAELVGGRSVVLIGGVKRPQQAEALTDALNLKELIWVEGATRRTRTSSRTWPTRTWRAWCWRSAGRGTALAR